MLLAGPPPRRYRPDGVQVGVVLGPRILLSHLRAELDVRAYGGAERLVVGQACFFEGFEVERAESVTLHVGDLAVPVDVDDVREADLAGETIRAAE